MLWMIIISLISALLFCLVKLIQKPAPLWEPEGMGSHGPDSRKLGQLEKLLAFYGEYGHGQITSAAFFCSRQPITEYIMCQACSFLAKRHPLLRMKLGRQNGIFTYMKEIRDFKVDLEVCNTDEWIKLTEDELLDVLDAENGPLWRVKFLPETSYHNEHQDQYPYKVACVFTFHHTIVDGISVYKLCNELIDLLCNILDGKELAIQPLPLLPPLDTYLDITKKYTLWNNLKANLFGLAIYVGQIGQIWYEKSRLRKPVWPSVFADELTRNQSAQTKTCIIPFELTSEQTSKLIASCKEHKVSVNSALHAACCIAFCKVADGGEVTKVHMLKVGYAFIPLDHSISTDLAESIGSWAPGTSVKYTIRPNQNFWDVARDVNGRIKNQLQIKKVMAAQDLHLMKNDKLYNHDYMFTTIRKNELFMSNIGNMNFISRDDTSNVHYLGGFTTAAHHLKGPIFHNAIATNNGKIFWTLSYCPRVISRKVAQIFVDQTLLNLHAAMK